MEAGKLTIFRVRGVRNVRDISAFSILYIYNFSLNIYNREITDIADTPDLKKPRTPRTSRTKSNSKIFIYGISYFFGQKREKLVGLHVRSVCELYAPLANLIFFNMILQKPLTLLTGVKNWGEF